MKLLLCRYILAYMGFLGAMVTYFCRINLSVAVVAMVGVKRGPSISNTTYCPERDSNISLTSSSPLEDTTAEFSDWTTKDQSLLLSSYFYGYFACQMPTAWLSAKLGFKRVLGTSMLLASLLTLAFPLAVRTSYGLGLACRAVLGATHAAFFPSMTGALGVWAPPLERSRLNGLYVAGASFGTFTIFPLAGVIAHRLGWTAVFYSTGVVSLAWCLAWTFLVYDSPNAHPRISHQEREYIVTSLTHVDRTKMATPWLSILTSLPVWGIILGHTASNWGNYMLNTQLPTYYANVLRFDLSTNGLLTSLPYILQWFVCLAASWITDYIRSRGWMSTISIRKLNTFLGLWVTGGCLVLAGYSGCNAILATSLFILSAGLNTLTVPGCKSNMLDIAPAFSGIVMGVSNTVANIPGFLAPTLVGLLLHNNGDLPQWILVFWVSAAIHVAGSIVFLIWGQDQLQPWALENKVKDIDGVMENKINDMQGDMENKVNDMQGVMKNKVNDMEIGIENKGNDMREA